MAQLTRPSPVFTHPEWTLSNHLNVKTAEVDRTQAERIHAESDRVIDATAERTDKVQKDVNKKLRKYLLSSELLLLASFPSVFCH